MSGLGWAEALLSSIGFHTGDSPSSACPFCLLLKARPSLGGGTALGSPLYDMRSATQVAGHSLRRTWPRLGAQGSQGVVAAPDHDGWPAGPHPSAQPSLWKVELPLARAGPGEGRAWVSKYARLTPPEQGLHPRWPVPKPLVGPRALGSTADPS